MSHRANLLPFISRKTHVRHDWCESMKRQMKSEIRSNRKRRNCGGGAGVNAPPQNICYTTAAATSHEEQTATVGGSRVIAIRLYTPDVGQDNTKVSQQFYCSKLHLDVEYDHELVKRMRVVNLNAMTCLRMPTGFERFLSYFNVGNIGNAGRVMTRVHGMRESYIPRLDDKIAKFVKWLQTTYFDSAAEEESNDGNFTIFSVNEIPVMRRWETIAELDTSSDDYVRVNVFSLWKFILASKYSQPGCTVTVTHLYDRSYCVNIRVAHGVPLCPVNLNITDITEGGDGQYAVFCDACEQYRSSRCLTLTFSRMTLISAWKYRMLDCSSVLPPCSRHVWFTRHELTLYYQTFDTLREPRPLMHEIACHGFLSIACYPLSTDISKIIVSINAHRRALDIVERFESSSSAAAALGWSHYGEGNGKFTRLVVLDRRLVEAPSLTSQRRRRMIPHKAVRLLFAFGDVDMLNCEDGYVLNRDVPLLVETLFRKKITLSCKAPLSLVTKMILTYERYNGARLHIGTIYSAARINIPSGNDVLVYQRINAERKTYIYDLYMIWNQSFVQRSDGGQCRPCKSLRCDDSRVDGGGGGGGGICMLREEHEYEDDCPIAASGVEVYDRFMRIWMRSRPCRQTIKLQNSFGQKGVAHYADLSDLVTDRGEPVDVISSMYSLV